MEKETKIYTEKEAARFLRISTVTLWRLRKAGKISFRRTPKIIYTDCDLQTFLEVNKRIAFAAKHQD